MTQKNKLTQCIQRVILIILLLVSFANIGLEKARAESQILNIQNKVRNLSDGQIYFYNSISADPLEVLEFQIQIKANSDLQNLYFKENLPDRIIFREGTLKIDGVSTSSNFNSGIFIGNLSQGQTKTITFLAHLADASKFNFGSTNLINIATVYNDTISISDLTTVTVSKTSVLGASTQVNTGLTDNILVDSLVLPLIIALVLTFIFRIQILNLEQWLDKIKMEKDTYHYKKILQKKIKKIKEREEL